VLSVVDVRPQLESEPLSVAREYVTPAARELKAHIWHEEHERNLDLRLVPPRRRRVRRPDHPQRRFLEVVDGRRALPVVLERKSNDLPDHLFDRRLASFDHAT
jgi:hypothetical protein